MNAPRPSLFMLMLLAAAVALGTVLHQWRLERDAGQDQETSVLTAFMGDSRRLFANHFFLKADAYYHSGYYPSIFDRKQGSLAISTAVNSNKENGKPAEPEHEGHNHDEKEHDCDYLHQPLDWMDRFTRHYYPSEHTHVDEQSDQAERELLPWLKLAAQLDPQHIQTYIVAAYWLRLHIGRIDQAELFLREGLRANPGDPEILFELGKIFLDGKKDTTRARNIWEAAFQKWGERETSKDEPNILLRQRIVGELAVIEEKEKNWDRAIHWLEELKKLSPNKQVLEQEIEGIKAKKTRSRLEESQK